MVLSRRFLLVAALAAVFALGLAGTALAAHYVWRGTGGNLAEGDWKTPSCWDLNSNFPGTNPNDTVEIPEGSVVTVGDANFPNNAVDKITFKGGAKLLYNDETYYFRTQALEVEAGEVNIVVKKDDRFAVHDTATNVVIKVGANAVLTLEGKKIAGGAGALRLTGAGKLVLKAPVTTVTDLKITEGGTLVADVDNALPLTSALTIDNGSIVVNGTGFGATSEMTLSKGNLTLNKPMRDTLNKVTMGDGTLTVADGVKIGKNAPLDGAVDLKDKGHLVLNGNLTLKDLKTVDGSKITANGNVLTIIPTSPFVLDAEIDKGTLSLDVAAGQTATLSKDVENVVFNGKSGGAPTLKFEERVFVNHLDIRGSTMEPASLDFVGEHTIGTLEFMRTTPLVVSYSDQYVKVEKLILAGGAALDLELRGGTALTIKDGTPGKNWKVTMGNTGTDFRVHNAGLLSGNVEVTLGGGTLYLPHGAYPNLILKADSPSVNPTIDAEFFEGDPVLTVGKVDINNSNLRVKATGVWRHGLKAGDTLTLLEVNETNLSDGKVISGDPEVDSSGYLKWKWERLEGTKTKLVLTALKTISVPDLVAEASYSGNKCTVNVKVSGDVKVNESNWNADMILGDRPENDPAYKNPKTGSEKGAVFEVKLPTGFTSGTLRVKATNKEGGNFQGFVDVPLERTTPGGEGNGNDEADKPVEIDNTSWTATALTGESGDVTLRAKLKLVGTPKSLKVEASGMKAPKAELLDAAGKVVLTSSIPSVSAGAKDHTLKLTCRTTKAEIAAGAEIKTVTVTMANGTRHKIAVNKKLKDMKPDTNKPDNNKPGGDNKPGDGNKPGDNNPGDNKPGDGNKPGEGRKGGSGGGCDAGVGGLALVLGAAFLLRRKV